MTASNSATAASTTTAPPTRGAIPRIAVVLGGGGTLGTSFHAGVLLALRDEWGIDAHHVDSLTGTSAGALTAGFVASGMTVDELFDREVSHDRGNRRGVAIDDAPLLLGDDRVQEHHADVAAGPREHRTRQQSRRSKASLQTYFDRLLDNSWPDPLKLRLCCVEVPTGRLIALDSSSGATPGQAVAASCSLPGLAAPVRIAGRAYIDGAVHSMNNVGSVASMRPDIVIVSAPLSIDRLRLRLDPMTGVRNVLRLQTALECRTLAPTTHVVVIEPTPSDATVMGTNLNAAHRRGNVARRSYRTARATFARNARPTDNATSA